MKRKNLNTYISRKTAQFNFAALIALAAGAAVSSCAEVCRKIDKEAQSVIAENQKCEPGSACKVVSYEELIGKNCIAGFQCYGAFPENADLSSFAQRGKELSELQQHCGTCVAAFCLEIDQYEATCNPETRRCELTQKEMALHGM